MIDPEEIERTESLIRPFIRTTPVLRLPAREFGLHCRDVVIKFEYMQHTGSFKTRGAFSNLLQRDISAAGVVAASGGNHGAAVAYAASQVGSKATIFVPSISSAAKQEQIKGYSADLVVAGKRYDDALHASQSFVESTGATAIHAFDQRQTLSGQGTVALELEAQNTDFDSVLVSVGGGGFIGGVSAWFQNRVRVVGVEPELSPTLFDALAAGHPVDAAAGGIAADSLAPKRIGDLMFPIAQRYVEQVVLVADADIRKAQTLLWKTLRVVVEPGAAVGLAALISGCYEPAASERVALILCGANMIGVDFGPAP